MRLLEYATGKTARVLGKPSPRPWPRSAADRTPRWSWATTWSPTSAVGEVGAAVVLARSGKGDRLQPGAEAEPYVHHLQPPSTACPAPNLRD